MKKIIYLILILFISMIKSQDYIENNQLYCKAIDKTKWVMSDEERIAARESIYYLIKGNLGSIVGFLNENNFTALLTGIIINMILVCLLIVGSFTSLVIFNLFCCYLKKSPAPNKIKAKNYWIVSLVMGILFLIFFIIFIIFLKKMDKGTDEINCALSNSAVEILDGANNDNYEFIGFNILVSMLESFESEVEQIKSVTDNFDAIFNLNLLEKGQAPIISLNEFYNTYKDRTIKDGTGEEGTPIVIKDLEKTKDEINTQFEIWNNIAKNVSFGSEYGKKLSTNDAIIAIREILIEVISQTKIFKNELESPLNNLSREVGNVISMTPSIYVYSISIGILNVLLFLFTIVVLFFQCKKLKCYKCNCCLKFILILMSLSSFVYSLVSLYVMVITASVGTVCNDIPNILAAEDPASLIASIGVGMNDQLNTLANNCILESNSGNFTDLMKNTKDFSKIELLLNGVTTFKNFEIKLVKAPEDSGIITNTTKTWENYNSGYFVNFENINTTLKTLNTQLQCENQEMEFNKLNCSKSNTITNCIVIREVIIPYNPPDCVDDSTVTSNNYRILRDYDLGNGQTISKMILDLQGEESNTANTKYKDLKNTLNIAMNQQKIIEPKIFKTLNKASKLNFGFSTASNCQILRKELLNVEAGICFKNANNLLFAYIFAFFMNLFLLLFIWGIFCTIRNIVEDRPFNKLNDSVELGDNVSESGA